MSWLDFFRRRKHQILGDNEDFLLVTWDSCRYDAYLDAHTPALDEFGKPRRAWAMATYTAPAHEAMFYGFLPHVFEPEPLYNRYCQQVWRISHRNVNVNPLVTFPLGQGNVVNGFRRRGYATLGVAAMDWFRDAAELRQGFERFEVTGVGALRQNQWLERMLKKHAARRPCFAFVNYGETHSPFHFEGMESTDSEVEHRFGLRRLFNQRGLLTDHWEFDEQGYRRQVAAASYLDNRTAELIEIFRYRGRPTTVIVCSDHGECFGENGLYGHAFYHERVMEVPMLIFRLNAPAHLAPQLSRQGLRGLHEAAERDACPLPTR
jgi:membrane-anchored protein YejM (alkaline phosphatase superfamily)